MAIRHRASLGLWACCALCCSFACSNLSALSNGAPNAGDGGDAALPEGGATADAGGCATDPCVLATGLNHPVHLTSDTDNVYWTEYGDDVGSANGALKSCPVSGCAAAGPVVLAAGLINPVGVAVDGGTIYFATAGYAQAPGGIFSCPTSGCNGSPTKISVAGIPQQIVLDATYVYWVDYDDDTAHRALRTGGSDHVLYDAGDGQIAEPEYCAVDSTSLYVGDANQDLFRIPLPGGDAVPLFTAGTDGVCPIILDATNIYYAALGQVVRLAKPGDGAGVPIAKGLTLVTSVLLDPSGSPLYWTDFGLNGTQNGSVGEVGTNGAMPTTIASDLDPVNGVALVGNYVLWITSGSFPDGGDVTTPSTGTLVRHAR